MSDFQPKAAAYTARYIMARRLNDAAHYRRVDPDTGEVFDLVPEFNRMSRRPALGVDFVRLFWKELSIGGTVVVDGHEAKSPRMYDKMLKNLEAYEQVQLKRYQAAQAASEHSTPERLKAREQVSIARLNLKKRHSEV